MKQSKATIRVYDPNTYPQPLHDLVDQNRDLFHKYKLDSQEDNLLTGFYEWLKENSSSSSLQTLMRSFSGELEDVWIEAFHITRTFSDKDFLKHFYLDQGLQLPPSVFKQEYFKKVFAQINFPDQVADYFFQVFNKKCKFMKDRMKTISVFSYPSEYILNFLHGGYWNLYGGTVFGEIGTLIRDELPDNAKWIFDVLEENTCPHIIRLRFKIGEVYDGLCEYPLDFVLTELIEILASKYFYGNRANQYLIDSHNSVFLGHVGQPILRDNILGIYNMSEWEEYLK